MDWMNQLGGLLQQYAGGQQSPERTEEDFDNVSRVAPPSAVSGGLAEAFRSQQTPPFPNMLGQMFGQSNPNQRASILNTLLATAGPALLSQILSRTGGGGGLGSLGGLLGGGQTHVTPEVAAHVPAEAVEELAREAEQRDPSVIDRVSDFYAEHPSLVKGLGAAALGIALNHLAKQKRGGLF